MKKNKTTKILNISMTILPFVIIVLVWTIASISVKSDYILPSVISTLKAFFNLFTEKNFYIALLFTILRSLIAFIISFILAFVLAYISTRYAMAKKVIRPIISVLRALPTVAVVLLLLVWTNSNVAPVIVTMLVVLPTSYTDICNSFNEVDSSVIEMCKFYKVSEKEILLKVFLPQIAPSMLISIGANLSLNLKLMVAAEVLSQTAKSIGLLLNNAKVYYEIATMMALVIVVVLIGLIIEGVFSLLSKRAGKFL